MFGARDRVRMGLNHLLHAKQGIESQHGDTERSPWSRYSQRFVTSASNPKATWNPTEPREGVTVTELSNSIVLTTQEGESTSAGFRGSDLVFTLTQSCGNCFVAGKEMTREPNVVLSAEVGELECGAWDRPVRPRSTISGRLGPLSIWTCFG
jgi:hypothetical protein